MNEIYEKCKKYDCNNYCSDKCHSICVKCTHYFKNSDIQNNYEAKHFKLNIICLSGKVGSGKDTIANYLAKCYNFHKFSFADELKNMLKANGWDEKKDLKGRKLLQQVGLAFRNYDEYYWIDSLIYANYKFVSEVGRRFTANICLTDCRHVNEIEQFYNRLLMYYPNYRLSKQISIQIKGPNHDISREMDNETLSDISETGLDKYTFNYVINNFSTLEEMYAHTDVIMKTEFPDIKKPNCDTYNNI